MIGPENHWITRQAIKLAIQNTRFHRSYYWMIKTYVYHLKLMLLTIGYIYTTNIHTYHSFYNRYPDYETSKVTWVASKKIGSVLNDRTVRCSNSSQGKLIMSINNNGRRDCQISVRLFQIDVYSTFQSILLL